jgi:hypothetical protein
MRKLGQFVLMVMGVLLIIVSIFVMMIFGRRLDE